MLVPELAGRKREQQPVSREAELRRSAICRSLRSTVEGQIFRTRYQAQSWWADGHDAPRSVRGNQALKPAAEKVEVLRDKVGQGHGLDAARHGQKVGARSGLEMLSRELLKVVVPAAVQESGIVNVRSGGECLASTGQAATTLMGGV